MTNIYLLFILSVLIVIFILLLYNRITWDIIEYKIENTGIDIVLLGILPFMRISYNNIKEIKMISLKESMTTKDPEIFMALRIGNRLFGKAVLVRKKKGFIRAVLITPGNPEKFIQEVRDSLP